jgi:hypothetical protein
MSLKSIHLVQSVNQCRSYFALTFQSFFVQFFSDFAEKDAETYDTTFFDHLFIFELSYGKMIFY